MGFRYHEVAPSGLFHFMGPSEALDPLHSAWFTLVLMLFSFVREQSSSSRDAG